MAKTWNQLKCLSVSEWMNEPWYFHIMEYYSAMKYWYMQQDWRISEALWWMKEVSLERLHTVQSWLYYILEKTNSLEMENTLVLARG